MIFVSQISQFFSSQLYAYSILPFFFCMCLWWLDKMTMKQINLVTVKKKVKKLGICQFTC